MNLLEPFNILDHVDRLTLSEKATKSQPYYYCPVCGGSSLTFNKQGKFRCWSGGCDSKAIMEAIRPLKDAIAEAKQKTAKWVKPPRPKATYEFFYPDRNGEKLVKVTIAYSGESSKKDVKQHWWTGTTWQSFDMPDEVKHKVRLYQIDHAVNQDAIATGKPIIVGESESKVDLCLSIGLAATCNIGGSGKWEAYGGAANLYGTALQGANIVLSPDRGRSGLGHCQRIAQDFPNAQWVYADPTNPKWDDLNKRYFLAPNGKAPQVTEATQSWLGDLPNLNEDDQLWNWLDGDEYDLKNWIEEINDPILAKQMILDAIEPQRPYEIKRLSASPALFSKPSNVVPINSKSIPPHDLNAEHFVIGQFLLDSSHVAIVLGTHVSPDHFYHPLSREICHAIAELIRGSQPVDILSVHAMLARKGFGDKVSVQDLKGYRDRAEDFADNDVIFQAGVIKDKYLLRTGQTLGRELTKLFTDESKATEDLITEMQQAVLKFTSAKAKTGQFSNIGDVMRSFAADIAKRKAENDGEIVSNYFSTGIGEVDAKIDLPLGKLIGAIASSSHGKTTWSLQTTRNISLETGLPTIFCSYEISGTEAGLKHAVMETGFSIKNLRTQNFSNEGDRHHFERVADAYSGNKMFVYESNESVEKLCSSIRSFAIQHGQIGCICIDYIQLVKPEKSMGNDTANYDYVADMLDALRKELNCLMIWLIQPVKSVEDRNDKRPQLADSRGTAVYRQKVDLGLYLYRDERYNPNSPDRGMIEIGCEKYRDGEAGWNIKVPFDGRNSRIGNSFTSLLDRMAVSNTTNATKPTQLHLVPQPQTATIIKEGAIAEPDVDDFF